MDGKCEARMALTAVVEDEPSISEVVNLYLKRAGFQVVVYADGMAAEEGFNSICPGVFLFR